MMDDPMDTVYDQRFAEIIAVDVPSNIKDFVKDVADFWLEYFENGCLSSSRFEDHWKVWVPKIYSPPPNESCLNWNFNEDLAQDILLNTLDEFIFNGNSATVSRKLSTMDKKSSICGRVFKYGEPTYSCRECGVDKTCVLCVKCFKNSDHRHHKYKMGTSSGGGCCDCGDMEAWKKSPYCTAHQPTVDQVEQTLPEDLIERTHIVFDVVLWYAYRLLSTEQMNDTILGKISVNFFHIDSFCTILYNDEIHTFDQVITTLTRVLKCSHRNSTEYVTSIDREGRAIVKCSNFQHCLDLKSEIEKYTSRHGNKPLKVVVNHSHVIAHQIFALKLLTWTEKILSYGSEFRKIFADVALIPHGKDPCIIKGILQTDSSLWKNARTQWHRLLISGMLLEYENKMALAKIFTRNYGQVTKDFIKDDHEHSYSISSLSVQIFTVPTIAHELIAHDDVLYILLNTLLSECYRKCNKEDKLEFERNPSNQSFKRAVYMLYDLKYLLSAVPEKWTDELRKSFLHGLSMMFNLLNMMQGMDAVVRQVGQHMEYEPEWESGFNLHIKLADCISLAVEWCGTDKIVLIKAYRSVLKQLEENPCYEKNEAGEPRELADHSTACLQYDVASKPVSIHLPLTRFLAALHLHLEKMNLHFDSPEFHVSKPTPVQIMEPVLRAQVMIAQVHAGMWRRNGYALLNSLYFYHNVKCRTEMLDRDITLLQIAASLIESNEYLIHLLNKFNLINWAMPDFEVTSLKSPEEDSMIQIKSLVEELLHLLIVIIGERYMPGISKCTVEDRIRKEIIQHLCIKPLPHSELTKSIPEDLSSIEIAVDEIIEEVAIFKKPTHGSGKGAYELKEQYYDEFNVFFYHYTREDLSKAEESQRKRNKAKGELECCPPPKLPKLTESFAIIVNLLQCDVMLHIIQTVLERCVNLRARSFSESQLQKVAHIIGYALLEEESKNYPFFKFIENSSKFKIFTLLVELVKSPRVESHKDLLRWVLAKYKKVSNNKDYESSTLSITKESSSGERTDSDKKRRARLAAERRAKLMAQMQAMQNSFIKENAVLFEETITERKTKVSTSIEDMEVSHPSEEQTVALGTRQSTRLNEEKTYVCILCQEEEHITVDGSSMVLAAFVQQATVLCQNKTNDKLMDILKHDPLYLNANLGPAPHTSTCGHVMHSECWRKYFDNVMVREHRRPYRLRHPASFDVDKQEFLCPLCECLSNTVLPLVPPLSILQLNVPKNELTFDDWIANIGIVLKKKQKVCHGIFKCDSTDECTNMHCNACVYSNGTSIEQQGSNIECEVNCIQLPHQVFYSFEFSCDFPQEFIELFPGVSPNLENNHKDIIHIFTQMAYTRGLDVNPHPSDKRLAPMNWKSLAYTIHSVEVSLRDANKPLLGHLSSRQRDCIENFIRVVSVLGSTWPRSVFINSYAINLLSILFEHGNDGPSILQWDSLGFLISLTFSLPSLSCKYLPTPIPSGGILDLHSLRIIFISHIVKILVLMKDNLDSYMDTDTVNDNGLANVLKIVGKYRHGIILYTVWEYVKNACLPFLRCCVLFYHYLTEVAAPLALTEVGGDTFANMCAYLDLPQTPRDLFNSNEILVMINRWCSHEEVTSYLNGSLLEVIQEPLPVPHLIELPIDYSDLINHVSMFTCPKSDEDSKSPSMCLVCGEILCSQSYCCQTELNKKQVGACNYHASKCGAGVGLFLRVRECDVLLLATPLRGCFVSPPYLDDYGETDQGLRRGNPLRLCNERYKKLQTLWLSHGIHEEIARSIETSAHIISTQWNLL